MSDQEDVLARARSLIDGNAYEVIATIGKITDAELLNAAAVEEQKGKTRVRVLTAIYAALAPPPPTVELITMTRDEPQFVGGPVVAKVHPKEVRNYAMGGWSKD